MAWSTIGCMHNGKPGWMKANQSCVHAMAITWSIQRTGTLVTMMMIVESIEVLSVQKETKQRQAGDEPW